MIHFFFIICTWSLFSAATMDYDEGTVILNLSSGVSAQTCHHSQAIVSASREPLHRKFTVAHSRTKETAIIVPDNFFQGDKSCIILQRTQKSTSPEQFAEIAICPLGSGSHKLTVSAFPSAGLNKAPPILECTLKGNSQNPGAIVAQVSQDFFTLRIKPPCVKQEHYEVHVNIHIPTSADDFSFTSCVLQIFDSALNVFTSITSVHIEKTLVARVIHEDNAISPYKEGLGTQDGCVFDVINQKLFHLYGAKMQPQIASKQPCPSQCPSLPVHDDIQERISALKEHLQKAQERGKTSPPHIQLNTLMHSIEAGLLTLTKSLSQQQEQKQVQHSEGQSFLQEYPHDAQNSLRVSFEKLQTAFFQLQKVAEHQ